MTLTLSNTGLKLAKVRPVKTPTRGTPGSAGIDFYVPDDYPQDLCTVDPGERYFIPSGIKANFPTGFALISMNKSGISLKKNLMVGACVVDSDYQGEIHLHLINVGPEPVHVNSGDKLVQFLLIPVDHSPVEVINESELYSTESKRGAGGFGSTGEI